MTKIKPIGQDGDVESFLAKVRSLPPVTATGKRGRLVLAMDATMSRQPTWDRALSIQADMFAETGRIGGLDVQLVYFRGFNECRASRWTSDAQGLGRLMTGVECRGGNTQILRVLKHVKAEAD
ncbi:MAG: VWA domain-containing protein, partial [Aestuariivirga sp.]